MKQTVRITFLLAAAFLCISCAKTINESEASKITERSFHSADALPSLEEFSVQDTISHLIAEKKPFVDLQNLRYYNRRVNRSDLLPFQSNDVSHIKVFLLSDLQLDDIGIEPIDKMDLTRLSLSYNPVRDLHALRRMKSLEDLGLDYTQVSRSGFEVIAGLKNLRLLYLNGTPITDADLLLLSPLKKLEVVAVGKCKSVTPAGVAKLRRVLPHCQVYTTNIVRSIREPGMNDLNVIENRFMAKGETSEADLALQKYIAKWSIESPTPYALLAEAFRLRAECQKALGNKAASETLMAESSKFGKHVKDLKESNP